MLGLVSYRGDAAGGPLRRVIGGARFRVVYVARGEGLRAGMSARIAARTLAREGVRCAVFPPEYPYRERFTRYGVVPPSLAPLYRATAAAIVRCVMAERGIEARRATLAFAAERVTPELERAAETLCADARHIVLAVLRGGEALAQKLRRDLGVAAQVTPPNALPPSDLTVAFDGVTVASETLRLDEALGVVYDSGLPNELLAALWRAGALDAETLAVRAVLLTPPADARTGAGPAP